MSAGSQHMDDFLRRELHAAVEGVEPSADALERIRSRMYAPRHARVSMALAGPGLAGHACRTMLRALSVAGYLLQLAFASAASRFRPAATASRYRWLRPAAAFGTAVFVVAAGSWAVTTLPQVISPSANSASHHGSPGGPGGPSPLGTGHPHSSLPGMLPTGTGQPSPSGSTSCSPRPGGSPSARKTPSKSPSPSPTPSPSVSPSQSTSPSPTPSPSPSTSAATAPSGDASQQPAALLQLGRTPRLGLGGAPKREGPGHKASPSPSGSRCG